MAYRRRRRRSQRYQRRAKKSAHLGVRRLRGSRRVKRRTHWAISKS